MAAQVGALRVTLGANTADFQAGMTRAQISARRTGQTITSEMNRAKVATTTAFASMKSVAAGFGIGLATAGVAGIMAAARASLEYASGLGETAQQIGVTVEQLQILSRMAIENGASQETMQRSLARLNLTLGDAKSGTKSALEAFTRLGFTTEQIGRFGQGGDALREIAQRIMAIPDPARQAAAAQDLFGRAGQQLLPLLRNIATGYDEASAKAREMGLLTAEQAARADEAKDSMDAFAHSLQTRLAIAIADNLGPINDVIQGLEQLIGVASSAIGWLDSLRVGLNNVQDRARGFIDSATDALIPGRAGIRRAAQEQIRNTPTDGFVWGMLNSTIPSAPTARPGMNVNIPTTGSRGSSGGRGGADRAAAEAARARQEALRDEHQFQSEMRRLRIDELREQETRTQDAILRNDLQREVLAIEVEQQRADRELQVALGELNAARAQELQLAQGRVDSEREATLENERELEVNRQSRELRDAEFEAASARLQNEVDAARTSADRRDAELRLLDLTIRHERAKLASVILAEGEDSIAAQERRARLDALEQRRVGETAAIQRDTMSPLEAYMNSLPATAAEANEALESVAANGLQSVTDGLTDAIMMTRSWGDVFKNVAKQIIADLIKIQIQRALVNLLGSALGGVGGDKGAGLKYGGPKALGGPVVPGRYYVVGERGPELFAPGAKGSIIPNNDNGRGPPVAVNINLTYNGNLATQEDVVRVGMMIKPAAIQAITEARRRGSM